jgi:prephenate dehydrogenase
VSVGAPLGIAGVGLIGGSIALRARARGIEVVGFDSGAGSIGGIVDRRAGSLAELARECRTLVLALPVDATLAAIDTLRSGADESADLVLDVASVKLPIVRRAAGWRVFVATHPIAGAEQSGPRAARADLFVGRTWTYVATKTALDARVREFIETMGGRPFAIDAKAHDEALALTSHLPQVVVSALAALIGERSVSPALAGPGLISTLRLAGSPWSVWESVLQANAPALASALRDLGRRLSGLAEDLEAGDTRRAASYFGGANGLYEILCKMNENR